MELFHLFKALNRKKWIILACVLVAVATAFLLTMNKKNQYKSSSQIATGYTNPDKIKINDEHFNTQQIDVKFNNLIENFSSSRVLELLTDDVLLHDLTSDKPFKKLPPEKVNDPSYKSLDLTKIKNALQLKLSASSVEKDAATGSEDEIEQLKNIYGYTVGWVNDNLQVSRYQRTDYVNISFVSESPTLSAYVVNEIIPVFSNYYNQSRKESTDLSVSSLDSIMKAKKAILDAKIAAKSDYMTARSIVDVGMQGGNNLSQISGFENQLAQEKGNQQSLQYKVQQLDILYKQAKDRAAKTVSKGFSATNDSYITLKKQYSDLNKEYIQKGSNDPEIKRRLDDILSRMQKLDFDTDTASTSSSGDLSPDAILQRKIDAEGDLRASNEKISQIESKINELNSSLNGMAAKGADITKLDKDIEVANSDYSAAKDKLNTALSLSENSNVFDQTMYGQPAYIPEPSHRGLIIGMAGAAALILSSIVIIFLEFLDQSIKTPSQFQRLTHLPFLGAVNMIDIEHKNILENISRSSHEEKNRDNTFRELLRKLRFEIEDSGKRIFLITSTEPGQGKTTLIQALAYSLSLGKKKVLIIDTNFCNNDLTKDLLAKPVLEKFYVNGKPFSIEDAQGLISKTKVEGVDTIGCGEGDYTPSEILPKNHLLNYLGELLKVYDYIFLEGAPLNSYTDTRELIHYSDGLIAIFSSETSLTAIDKESIKFLKEQNDKFIGAILNKVEAENLEM